MLSFPKDVERHEMIVEHDAGLFRCVYFGRPGSGNMSFRLTTWPGHLAFSGDMGAYTFTRLRDMFEFFRGEVGATIDHRYWAEKCVAMDRSDGLDKFDADAFVVRIRELLAEAEASPDVIAAAEEEVIGARHDGEHAALAAAYNFNAYEPKTHSPFRFDVSEMRCREWSHRFLWCCCAIRWGIALYDKR